MFPTGENGEENDAGREDVRLVRNSPSSFRWWQSLSIRTGGLQVELNYFRRFPSFSAALAAPRAAAVLSHRLLDVTKIGNFYYTICRDENVLRFDVAMNLVLRMNVGQSAGNLAKYR